MGASEFARALLQFVRAVWSVSSVRKLSYSSDGGQMDLWVFMNEEDLEASQRVFTAEYYFRQAVGAIPFSVQIVPREQVDESALPSAEMLLER